MCVCDDLRPGDLLFPSVIYALWKSSRVTFLYPAVHIETLMRRKCVFVQLRVFASIGKDTFLFDDFYNHKTLYAKTEVTRFHIKFMYLYMVDI